MRGSGDRCVVLLFGLAVTPVPPDCEKVAQGSMASRRASSGVDGYPVTIRLACIDRKSLKICDRCRLGAYSLAAVFRVGRFSACRQGNRLLLLCGADGFAESLLNFGLVGTQPTEKHAAKPVQFGTRRAFFKTFDQCLRFRERGKSLGGTIGKVQSFSL